MKELHKVRIAITTSLISFAFSLWGFWWRFPGDQVMGAFVIFSGSFVILALTSKVRT